MTINQTLWQLKELNLIGMHDALITQMNNPSFSEMPFEDRVLFLIENEINIRQNKRFLRLFKTSKLRYKNANIEDIDYSGNRNINRDLILSLSNCNWIERSQNLIITGPTGTGKTYLASAFGTQACRKNFNVLFYTATELFETISRASVDGTLLKLRRNLARTKLLIIDDFGIGGVDVNIGPAFLDIIDQQVGNGSLIITSQFPASKWYDLFNDPTIADAVLDRLVYQAHFIEIQGESMRKRNRLNK